MQNIMQANFLDRFCTLFLNVSQLTITKLVIVRLLLHINPVVYAQEISDFTENDFTSDIPIMLSASRMPQRKSEAPESISIIDRDTIKALGVINIADIFRLIPGFQVALVRGNVFAVTYHGLTFDYPRRLQVLIDGR